ncbi:glycoside hydrolase family 6 protein [Nocardioides salsibiostraticola]
MSPLLRLLPLALLCSLLFVTPASVGDTSEPEAVGGNPLAGRTMGVYKGYAEQTWAPYVNATGRKKDLLGKIALAPKAKWFGDWISNASVKRKVRDYISNAQAGDPEALVQMAVFRMDPWEGEACRRLPTKAEKKSYRQWIRRFAQATGDTHAAIILQPDGPFALCAPGGSKVPSRLVKYAAKRFAALPNTSVYIDAGAWDWPHRSQGGVDAVLRFIIPGGIRFIRGIALNSTHYSDTELEIERGTAIVEALAARGITDKHIVINTSSSGNPFEFGKYDGKDDNNARVCRRKTDPRICLKLGIPPTTDVTNSAWGLSEVARERAAQHVDGYLWFGRPWLYRQADPFVTQRALALARTSPY